MNVSVLIVRRSRSLTFGALSQIPGQLRAKRFLEPDPTTPGRLAQGSGDCRSACRKCR